MASGRLRPYPLAALALALGIDPGDTAALAAAVDVDRSWIKRYRRWGLTEAQADRWAAAAGFHPVNVWPRWGDTTTPPAGLVNVHKRTCPQGHRYDRIDPRGFRVCSACDRDRVRRHRVNESAKSQVTQLVTPAAPHHAVKLSTMQRTRLDTHVPVDVAAEIRRHAADAGLSVSSWMCMTLTTAVRQIGQQPADPDDVPVASKETS